jgi:CDGSH-type Zn-finger protein
MVLWWPLAGPPARIFSKEAEPMTVKIICRPNGPYSIEGDVEIYDPTGAKVDTSTRPRISLCRCGASVVKPFCDGTHSKIGFAAAEAAVAQEKK